MMIKLARKAIKTKAVSQNRGIEIEGVRGRFCPATSGNLVCGPPRARPNRGWQASNSFKSLRQDLSGFNHSSTAWPPCC
jgi:hypothetical protein